MTASPTARPLGYYLPEFFASRDRSAAEDGAHPDLEWWNKSGELKDMGSPGVGLNNDQVAMEWNHGATSRRRGCHSAAPPSIFSWRFNGDGERERQHNDSLANGARCDVPAE